MDPHTGKIFAYVYTSEDQRFHCLEKVFDMFEFDKEQGESIAENAVKVTVAGIFRGQFEIQ